MSNAQYGDAARATLRMAVAAMERAVALLPAGEGKDPTQDVRASWSKVVEALALGPAPETRLCPTCNSVGMRAASRCGTCWRALEPLPRLPVTEQQEQS